MAAELVTPVDELTGVPLPLIQTARFVEERFLPDEHHPFHPRRDPLLEDVAGQALRHSRVQLTSYEIHHNEYHRTFTGPELPAAIGEKFRLVVLAASGYIPEQGLTFTARHETKLTGLSADQRNWLWKSKRIQVSSPRKVRDFLVDYTFEQDLSSINENTIYEFVHTIDDKRRWELGNVILGVATYRATEPIRDVYREAYRAALIPQQRRERCRDSYCQP